jgi:hypothetical protein
MVFQSVTLIHGMCGILSVLGTMKLSGSVVFLCRGPKFTPMTFLMSHVFPLTVELLVL